MFLKDFDEDFERINGYLRAKYATGCKIAVFGCGQLGQELAEVLDRYDLLECFIDNDQEKQNMKWNDYCVFSIQNYLQEHKEKRIVVAANRENTLEICKELERFGLIKGLDYIDLSVFSKTELPYILYVRFGHVYVELAQICITERCTLKCSKCAHACNMVPMDASDMTLEQIKVSADRFFDKIDFVKEFVLIGGEPLLHKHIKKAVRYIGTYYREKMQVFSITTNGTIVPDAELIALFQQYDLTIRVSDYSDTLPTLRGNYERFYNATKKVNTVIWKTNARDSWFDYGFFDINNGTSAERLISTFSQCGTPCREIRENKYYYCVMARSVAENTRRGIGLDEYLDFNENLDKKSILAFENGYVKKGYLSMCRFCRGSEAVQCRIPAAEQD